MIKILEFKEFKRKLNPIYEDEEAAPAATPDPGASAGAPAPPPPPPAGVTLAPPPPDMGAAPALPPDPNAAPAAPGAPGDYKFVFIQDAPNEKWKSEQFKTMDMIKYSITQAELDEWAKGHSPNDADAAEFTKAVKAGITGVRPMTQATYKRFKAEVKDGSLGTNMGKIEIKFENDKFKNPSTDSNNIDVVFLKSDESSNRD